MLLDDLNNAQNFTAEKMPCSMCQILAKLTEAERTKLLELLDDASVSKAALARILTSNGYKISGGTITRHTRKECRGFAG